MYNIYVFLYYLYSKNVFGVPSVAYTVVPIPSAIGIIKSTSRIMTKYIETRAHINTEEKQLY